MSRCWPSLVIRKIQIKTTTRYLCTPMIHCQVLAKVWSKGVLTQGWWGCWPHPWYTDPQLLRGQVCADLHPAVPGLGICPRVMKRNVHTETCTRMFTAALFSYQNLEAHSWWMGEGNGPIFTMEYHAAIKRDKAQKNLKFITLNGKSQTQKRTYCMVHLHENLEDSN